MPLGIEYFVFMFKLTCDRVVYDKYSSVSFNFRRGFSCFFFYTFDF